MLNSIWNNGAIIHPILHLIWKTEQQGCFTFFLQSLTPFTHWFHLWQPCQSCHALILLLIISTLSMSSWYDQTQINRYHCPSNAAIRLSLYLNLKCLSRRSPACKYAHVWLWGQRGRQELGRNAYFLEKMGAAGGLYQSCVSTETFSDARRHTSEMNNKAERWVRERSQEVDDFTCWGCEACDGQICRC